MVEQAEIGVIGLGVMGRNLVLNMNDHGIRVAVYNRTVEKVDDFLQGEAASTRIIGTRSVSELLAALKPPRRVLLMVKAGKPVAQTVEDLLPHLTSGDIIIDGGNSNYRESMRMAEYLEAKGLRYIGCGISGGEEGARHGPSIMPGGTTSAWPHVKEMLQAIAAKVGDNIPCCEWVGENGAGHFVKMVHNGIEYGDMQLVCEAYDLMKSILGMTPLEMSAVFAAWNRGRLNSYLIEITRDILAYQEADSSALVEKIVDSAGQKGTGKWTAEAAVDLGVPLTMIGEAVFARFLSSLKDERREAAGALPGEAAEFDARPQALVDDIKEALYAAKIVSYAQGYMLLRAASENYGWHLDYGAIALMWRGGCIIRAAFLEKIKEAYDRQPELANLLLAPYFRDQVLAAQAAWRRVVSQATVMGIPLPAMSSALAFFDGYRRERLPANLLQAQRDYFGAHAYERLDQPRGQFFHTDWIGGGGETPSGSYNA